MTDTLDNILNKSLVITKYLNFIILFLYLIFS